VVAKEIKGNFFERSKGQRKKKKNIFNTGEKNQKRGKIKI